MKKFNLEQKVMLFILVYVIAVYLYVPDEWYIQYRTFQTKYMMIFAGLIMAYIVTYFDDRRRKNAKSEEEEDESD